jgi:hypothetical protein
VIVLQKTDLAEGDLDVVVNNGSMLELHLAEASTSAKDD